MLHLTLEIIKKNLFHTFFENSKKKKKKYAYGLQFFVFKNTHFSLSKANINRKNICINNNFGVIFFSGHLDKCLPASTGINLEIYMYFITLHKLPCSQVHNPGLIYIYVYFDE